MPREKGILLEHDESSAATPRISTNDDARPRRQVRERLPSSVLDELWSIWRADPRVPSINSRRSWAISRNVNHRLVDGWFSRRRTSAKKAGQPMSDESYDLPLDPQVIPKREQSATPVEPGHDVIFYLPSDDTLVLVYPPDDDDPNDVEASSDTVFEDTSVESKRIEILAFKEAVQQPPFEHHQRSKTEPKPSPVDLDALEDHCNEGVLPENPVSPVCNQGQGKQSDFTCLLCSTTSVQEEVPSDSDAPFDPRGNRSFPCPRLDFLPDTISELSAIPFLFRTPRSVVPDSAVNLSSANEWTIVEDELGRLVNDRKLDFSFLDVPHLTSMELLV